MIAYLCSSGEKTTEICRQQLENFGFEVVLLGEKESWPDKYKTFISMASQLGEDCLRIDADVIPNKNIKRANNIKNTYVYMAQFEGYDFYKNYIGITGIAFYKKEAIDIIKKNWDQIDLRRPEATAWRLPEINKRTHTVREVCGIHGFFQTKEDLERHKKHKIERKQIQDYDFELASNLLSLK